MIPLPEVDATIAQQASHVHVLDEFGDGLFPHFHDDLVDRTHASSRLAIAAVSVSSKIRCAGSIEAHTMAASVIAAKLGSPIDFAETLTRSVSERPSRACSAGSAIALRMTQQSID